MNINLQQLEQSSTLLPGRETSLEGLTSGKQNGRQSTEYSHQISRLYTKLLQDY